MPKVLIANRGEIAVRIAQAIAELGWQSIGVFSPDDDAALHRVKVDKAVELSNAGPAGYLSGAELIDIAKSKNCDLIHPGYGFLSESSEFASACRAAGIEFVGPSAETLGRLGDKTEARALAKTCNVPVLEGSGTIDTIDDAIAFFERLPAGDAAMLKAAAGGGGRGMALIEDTAAISDAFVRCQSEAQKAFGDGRIYLERFIRRARHIEVQIVGDGQGGITCLGERDCTLQRRNQKLIEIAPCPFLSDEGRTHLFAMAERLGAATNYLNLGTIEFLHDLDQTDPEHAFFFIEANPRLQVEHTVTEAVFGLDLVQLQLRLAMNAGARNAEVAELRTRRPNGIAIQCRINAEKLGPNNLPIPATGTISRFRLPSGPGVRIDSCGYTNYTPNPRFDTLIAKIISHSGERDIEAATRKANRALRETHISGIETNLTLLQAILGHPAFVNGETTTNFFDHNSADLNQAAGNSPEPLYPTDTDIGTAGPPLSSREEPNQAPPGLMAITAPLQGTLVSLSVSEGAHVNAGAPIAIMEAMKMEHVIAASHAGEVMELCCEPGQTIGDGAPIVFLKPSADGDTSTQTETEIDLNQDRADLAEVADRHAKGFDAQRPKAVARRRKTNQRTARENIDDLCDPGSFIEYGPLVIAAQRRRRELDDLISNTPADGMITGIGRVNGSQFPEERAQCIVMSYDYTVLAGTQGAKNHQKKDRMFELAERLKAPIVLFTEGGGGRPGDTDASGVAGLDCLAFQYYGKLSGLVPLVAINSGRCFAGNAALLGASDVVIATQNSNIGMGGPAMIEGGGLGVFRPEDIGPMTDQVPNGVVDIPVKDEIEAVAAAKKYLSYFQGSLPNWTAGDQRVLRHLIPENRLRVYDIRTVINAIADDGSVLELRAAFGLGMITALIRIEGRPMGLIANNPMHLAGAITSDGADKAARFMQLCDAFDLPVLNLCDTPGIMVGPDAERTALVRHAARLFVTGANIDVPFFTVILRKGYGLGAQAMAGGSFKAPLFTIAWPTSEFGGMGLEGAVQLGYRKELEAEQDPDARQALYDQLVARMYEHGKGINMASHFEIDDVIDPAETRKWIISALNTCPPPAPRTRKKRPNIDTW